MASSKDGQWEHDSDGSQESYEPSNRDKTPAPSAPDSRAPTYHLRDSSQIKRPGRYRVDEPVGALTRPAYTHPRPPFNKDLARLIPWNTVPLDHPGPLSSDMAYERLLAERKRKKNNPDAADEISFRPFQHVLDGESPRPCVTHLSRKAPPQDLLGYLYTEDESVIDNAKFHPLSDKWSYRDEYDPEFSLDDFDEGQDESQRELERRKAAYVNWSSLSDGVKWAIVHDLSTDYSFSGATQQLGLSVDEVISFKRLYKRELEKWDAYEARIAGEVQDALKRAPNECARPFPRPDPNEPPAPALELVTDEISRDEINEGRRFLKFMGLSKYATDLDEWYGSGSMFFEIPQVLEIDLDFFEEPRYRYPGPPAVHQNRRDNFPQTVGGDPEVGPTKANNEGIERSFKVCPPSPDMPNPALRGQLRPLVNKKYNPDAMNLARQAFRRPFASKRMLASRGTLRVKEGPTPTSSNIQHNWSNGTPIYMDMIIYDPIERVRAETEKIRDNANSKDRPVGPQACAGYRFATEDDFMPGFATAMRSRFAAKPTALVPRIDKTAVPKGRKDSPAQSLSEVTEEGRVNNFAFDGPSPNGSADEQRGQYTAEGAGDISNNTPPFPAAGVRPWVEVMQRGAGNPSQRHAAGATAPKRAEHAGRVSSYTEPHVDPNHYGDSDASDPELDDFPQEKDDPNDRDYKQRQSGRRKKPASQKRTVGNAQLGSDAMTAQAPKKPRPSRAKSEPSGSNSKRNKKNKTPETTTDGKGTSVVVPFEPPLAMAPKNEAQRSQSADALPSPGTGAMLGMVGPVRLPYEAITQQSVTGTVPSNMQQMQNICSDSQLFEMGLLDQLPGQTAVHEEHSKHSAPYPMSKSPVLPKSHGEFVAQVGAKAATEPPSYSSPAKPEVRGSQQVAHQTGSDCHLAPEEGLSGFKAIDFSTSVNRL